MTMSNDEYLVRALEDVYELLTTMRDQAILIGKDTKNRHETDLITEASGLDQEQTKRSVEESLAKYARLILQYRKMRRHYLPQEIFGEPGWEMLLDLFINRNDGKPVNVSSLCLATDAPKTTALRYIDLLFEQGLIRKTPSPQDGRIIYIDLTENGYSSTKASIIELIKASVL